MNLHARPMELHRRLEGSNPCNETFWFPNLYNAAQPESCSSWIATCMGVYSLVRILYVSYWFWPWFKRNREWLVYPAGQRFSCVLIYFHVVAIQGLWIALTTVTTVAPAAQSPETAGLAALAFSALCTLWTVACILALVTWIRFLASDLDPTKTVAEQSPGLCRTILWSSFCVLELVGVMLLVTAPEVSRATVLYIQLGVVALLFAVALWLLGMLVTYGRGGGGLVLVMLAFSVVIIVAVMATTPSAAAVSWDKCLVALWLTEEVVLGLALCTLPHSLRPMDDDSVALTLTADDFASSSDSIDLVT